MHNLDQAAAAAADRADAADMASTPCGSMAFRATANSSSETRHWSKTLRTAASSKPAPMNTISVRAEPKPMPRLPSNRATEVPDSTFELLMPSAGANAPVHWPQCEKLAHRPAWLQYKASFG